MSNNSQIQYDKIVLAAFLVTFTLSYIKSQSKTDNKQSFLDFFTFKKQSETKSTKNDESSSQLKEVKLAPHKSGLALHGNLIEG